MHMSTQLRFIKCNAARDPIGESHGLARHSDIDVDRARTMRATGMTCREIGLVLGAPRSTVEAWTARRRRTAVAARVMVLRGPTPGQRRTPK
jgi:hypothetical protein